MREKLPFAHPRVNRMDFFGFFKRKPPIREPKDLADFIDEQAAFLMQKGIYEYSRARAGPHGRRRRRRGRA